ncbi:MAG: kynureninase [Saccharospirillum sp.]
MTFTRQTLREWDTKDPLAPFRQEFDLPDGLIYLNGNSLGALPRAANQRVRTVVEQEWGQGLIRSWNTADWVNQPQRLGEKIAPLIGAHAEEVIVADSTSVNLFKVVAAAMAMQLPDGRTEIITEPGNFPTDRYILQGLCQSLAGEPTLTTVPASDIPDCISQNTAVVVLTHVHYKTGRMHDMAAITRKAHESGALVVWDLSHSTGAVPVDLNGVGADFAVGCGYKYLNGGPGAPAFIFVAKRFHGQVAQPLSGWFGHSAPFAMLDDYEAVGDIRQMLTGTPSVVANSLLEVGLDLFARVDMPLLREKSVRLTDTFITLVEEACAPYGFELATPRNSEVRGSQVSLRHAEGYAIMQALIDRGVIGDYRAPDILRFGFAPLYVRFEDVWRAVDTLKAVMEGGVWQDERYQKRQAVT